MEAILTFLSKPIIVTTITLTVGSYLFARLTEARSKREKIREKSLQLLEEVGSEINAVISLMYGHIRRGHFGMGVTSELNEKRGALFRKRFSVKIRSKVFLQTDDFWQRYDQLTFEIDGIVRLMMSLSNDYVADDVVSDIDANRRRFAEEWPSSDRTANSRYEHRLSTEFVKWADMVWDRANLLITTYLEKLFR
jgi:hypothetical protein